MGVQVFQIIFTTKQNNPSKVTKLTPFSTKVKPQDGFEKFLTTTREVCLHFCNPTAKLLPSREGPKGGLHYYSEKNMQMIKSFSAQQELRVKTKVKISKPAGVIALICALLTQSAYAAPTELFISEYIEGSSFNKAIEIYNGTGAPVDLAAGVYTLELYSNGNASPNSTEELTGTIVDGDVYVLSNSQAALPDILAQSDITSGVINFNGDDGLVLRKGGVIVDSFGQHEVDPGSEWPGGSKDVTLLRKTSIEAGDTNFSDAFDTSLEWDSFPQNTTDNLGCHPAPCTPPEPPQPENDNWVVNEINADPASGITGDSNGDGTRHFSEDEFVELYNRSDEEEDISGWTLSTASGVRHTFPGNTVVPPGCSIVVFGGGIPRGKFGYSTVQTASSGTLILGNSGGSASLYDGASLVATATYGSEGGDNQSLTLDPDITGLTLDKHSTAAGAAGALFSPGTMINGAQFTGCPAEVKIHEVQGPGFVSPLVDSVVVIEGIVVGDFQDDVGEHGDLNGFFVQEEDADADADVATSEGVFVFNGSNPSVDVAQGDLVTVIGSVSEFHTQTQISSFSGITVVSSGNPLPTAGDVVLPIADTLDLEQVEGMSVRLPQDLTIAEYYNFGRYGEFVLSSDRLIQPTAIFEPSSDPLSPRAILDDLNSRDRIIVDDGRSSQNPDPAIHPNGAEFNLDNLFRGGDTVQDVTGAMSFVFGEYKVQPTQGGSYASVNPRTETPDPVGGALKFASFNVLNYFSTLDGDGPICGPAEDQYCRGADNAEEFTRQRDKIISAINALDADVVGLIEIENHATDAAVIDLVTGLNDASAPGTWDYVHADPIGDDVIKVAFIFKPASVSELGAPAVLDSLVDPRFNDEFNRPALAQTFLDTSNGAVFTLVINHFKSKGSDCEDLGDYDLDDGAGNCNLTRMSAAEAMVDWLATDPTGSSDADIIVLGDLNSYDKEDPIDVLIDGGYTDMAAMFGGELAYGYVFDGAIGYLDYALASPGLLAQITGVTNWHINSDEPNLIDYDTSFKQAAQAAIYAPDAYRSSDHDPVIGGTELLQYDFGGFRNPVDAVPALNKVNAGEAIPMKFRLNDDYGLDIIAPGYPMSQEIDCDDQSVVGDAEFAPSDDDVGLTFEDGQYKWVWKTSKAYGGSCRQFMIQLNDGGIHYANFKFK